MLNFFAEAAAADTTGTTQQPGSSWVSLLLMIGLMILFFYFMILRPQKKRDKQAREMRDALSVGDEIVTIGGICGRVTQVKEDRVTILSGESKMSFLKTAIASVTPPDEQ